MTTIVNLNFKSDSSFENSSIVYWNFWFQGLLSTTYQVEVTFSVKGGPEEQKSIFVKVFFSLKVGSFKNIFTTNFTTITNSLSLHSKVPLTGSKAQDYKEVIDLIKEKFLVFLRYERSTLILYKELSSTIFQSRQSVSQSVCQASVTPVQISTFCNI